MNTDSLRDDLLSLVGFLLTSAQGLNHEPIDYGTFRLLDASGRVLEIMQKYDLGDEFTAQLQAQIDEKRFGSMSSESLEPFLQHVILQYAAEIKRRLDNQN
jgi:hypothetical protein